jgi:hypothetical protein
MIAPKRSAPSPGGPPASIAAMPNKLRPFLLAFVLAASAFGLTACGGDDEPEPSISQEDGTTLLSSIQEIEDNVEVGSCLVASDRTETLISEIEDLPDSVDDEVRSALENGANNLRLLLADPEQCEGRTTTTEPTTTAEETTTREEPTTTRTQPTTTRETPTQTQTTQTQTQTQPTTPSGGVGAPGGL